MEKAVKSAAWITAASIATTLSGLVFWSVTAKLAGKAGLGAASFEVSVANTAAALLNIGLGNYALRFVPLRGGRALSTSLAAAALLSLAGGLTIAALGFKWAPIILASSLLSAPAMGALIASSAPASYFAAALAGSLLKLVLPFLLKPTPAFAAASVATAAVALAYAVRRVGLGPPSGWRELLAAGLSNYSVNFSVTFAVSLGVVVAGAMGHLPEAGVLYVVSMAVLAASAVSGALATASIPIMLEGGTGLSEKGIRAALGVNVPLAVAAGGASTLLMSLLGGEYVSDASSLAAAMPAIVELAAVSMASAIYNVEGKWGRLAELGLVSSASVALSTALLGGYQGPWLGLSLTIGFLPSFLLSLRVLPKRPLALGLLLVSALVPPAYLLGLPGALLGAAASIALLHATGVFRAEDYVALLKLLLR